MQNYAEIGGQTTVKNSRAAINDNFETIQSHNSGTTFPTTNLFAGMKCYRTDTGHTYTLTDVDKQTWVDDAAADTSKSCSGNAGTASKLAVPISVSIQDAGGVNTGAEVSFDGSGNLIIKLPSTIAAALNGSVTGNAATANKWATARTLTLTGNTTGSATIDGSGNVSLATATSYATKAGSAPASGGSADYSTHTGYVDNDSAQMRMHWSGQSGTPTWLWGSPNDASNSYVYNPANFSVNYANSAGNAGTLGGSSLATILGKISASNTGGIVAQSLGTNGYAKWSTGLILQWGTATFSGNYTVTLPVSFSSACYSVSIIGNSAENTNCRWESISSSTIKFGVGYNQQIFWTAIGV